jgi:hypothetical protein
LSIAFSCSLLIGPSLMISLPRADGARDADGVGTTVETVDIAERARVPRPLPAGRPAGGGTCGSICTFEDPCEPQDLSTGAPVAEGHLPNSKLEYLAIMSTLIRSGRDALTSARNLRKGN